MSIPLVPVPKIREAFPWWPYKVDGTYRLIKLGRLGCVRVGRNVYVNQNLLESFIAKHTDAPSGPAAPALREPLGRTP